MVLDEYLRQHNQRLIDILEKSDYTAPEIKTWTVIQYPDELLYKVAKMTKKKVSLLLYELLQLENPGNVRRVASDYAFIKALENENTYIYIPKAYRKKQTKLLTDILIEKNIFEMELGPMAKFNIVGKKIYETFLLSLDKGEEFYRIENKLANYFVLVHDKQGSLLCHTHFKDEENLP